MAATDAHEGTLGPIDGHIGSLFLNFQSATGLLARSLLFEVQVSRVFKEKHVRKEEPDRSEGQDGNARIG